MLKSSYVQGLGLLLVYVCFELAIALLPAGLRRDDVSFWREAVVGATLLGLLIYSQFCRYVGAVLILAESAFLSYALVKGYASEQLAYYKSGQLLMFLIVGQSLFGIVAGLFLLSPIFGREFVALRDDPDKRIINIEVAYRIIVGIILLTMAVFAYRDLVRLVLRIGGSY